MTTRTTLLARARQQEILSEAVSRGAKLIRCGYEWIGPCPLCGGRDRFSINLRKQVFNCRGCGVGGDVIDLVQHLDGSDFATAVAQLAANASTAIRSRYQASPVEQTSAADTTAAALAMWEEARNPIGTPGEVYLNRRSLQLAAELAGPVLRFHDALHFDGRRVPGLLALFRDVLTDEPTGIQRVFLRPSCERISRRMLGRVRGAAIKIDADPEVVAGLCVGEGLETCMAARALGFKPVWALAVSYTHLTLPTNSRV